MVGSVLAVTGHWSITPTERSRRSSHSPAIEPQGQQAVNQFPFNNRDFDRTFSRMQKQQSSLFRFAFGAWLVWGLICLAGAAGVVYVAIHFLSKVW